MGILDDVVLNARSAAEAVGKKAGQLVDASKLRFSIAEVSAEISKRYEALGQYIVENCRDQLSGDAEIVERLSQLDELKAQCEALTKELTDKQNKTVCPTCGKHNANTVRFCPTCGTQLISDEAPVEGPAEEPKQDENE